MWNSFPYSGFNILVVTSLQAFWQLHNLQKILKKTPTLYYPLSSSGHLDRPKALDHVRSIPKYLYIFISLHSTKFCFKQEIICPSFVFAHHRAKFPVLYQFQNVQHHLSLFYSSYKDMAPRPQITKSLFMYLFLHGMHWWASLLSERLTD